MIHISLCYCLCLLSAKLEILEGVGVGLSTVYSINVVFSHTHAHMCIYCINLHNGKQTSESYRRDHSSITDEAQQKHDELVCRS